MNHSAMTIEPPQILVFRTNITETFEVKKLEQVMNIPEVIKWNIDLDDCDKVLRVVTHRLTSLHVISAVVGQGVTCAELED